MKIGIVNDMAMAAEALRRVIASAPEHQVAWIARDGVEAVECCARDRPDLVLMDLIMPRLDGVEATRQIMGRCPCAILVVTATVSGNLNKVYQAMSHGALDAVNTPVLQPKGSVDGAAQLLHKIAVIGRLINRPPLSTSSAAWTGLPEPPVSSALPLVLIGSSTGGPQALATILSALPHDLPAGVVIAQHVDAEFVGGLASWLSDHTGHKVRLAASGQRPERGHALLAATNDHLTFTSSGALDYTPDPQDCPYRPSINVLFASAARHWSGTRIGVLLTGMGRDGAEGLLALRRAGAHTIAQDQGTCVVYGMPRAAAELQAAVQILPLPKIAPAIIERLAAPARTSPRSPA